MSVRACRCYGERQRALALCQLPQTFDGKSLTKQATQTRYRAIKNVPPNVQTVSSQPNVYGGESRKTLPFRRNYLVERVNVRRQFVAASGAMVFIATGVGGRDC